MGFKNMGYELLRIAMSVGAATIIYTTAGSFLCALEYGNMQCVPMTFQMEAALTSAGFVVTKFVSTGVGGVLIYYITGKWKRN